MSEEREPQVEARRAPWVIGVAVIGTILGILAVGLPGGGGDGSRPKTPRLAAPRVAATRVAVPSKLDAVLRTYAPTAITPMRVKVRLAHQAGPELVQELKNLPEDKDHRFLPAYTKWQQVGTSSKASCVTQCLMTPCACGAKIGDWSEPCGEGLKAELLRVATRVDCDFNIDNACFADMTPRIVYDLSGRPDLAHLEFQGLLPPSATTVGMPAVPRLARAALAAATAALPPPPPSNMTAIGAPTLWNQNIKGTGAIVGVIDSGVQPDHELLVGRGLTRANGTDLFFWDFSNFTGNYNALPGGLYPSGFPKPYDDIGRGTHMLSVAVGGNNQGVAPEAKWVACKAYRNAHNEDPTLPIEAFLSDEELVLKCVEWLLNPDWDPRQGANKPAVNLAHVPDVILGTWVENLPDAPCDPESGFRYWISQIRLAGLVPVFPTGDVPGGFDSTKSPMPTSFPEVFSVGTYNATKHCTAGTRKAQTCSTDDTNTTTGCPGAVCPGCCTNLSTTNYSGAATCRARYCSSGARQAQPCSTDDTNTITGCPGATCPNCCGLDPEAARSAPRVLAPGTATGAWIDDPAQPATHNKNTYTLTGSDVAAAHAAGAVALVLSKYKVFDSGTGVYTKTLPVKSVEYALERTSTGYVAPSKCEDGATACTPIYEALNCSAVKNAALNRGDRCTGGVSGTTFLGGAGPGLLTLATTPDFKEARLLTLDGPSTQGPINATPRICINGASPCTDQAFTSACNVSVKNTGLATWTDSAGFALQPVGGQSWNVTGGQVALGGTLASLAQHTYVLAGCKAPNAPGDYNYQWQLSGVPFQTPARTVSVAGTNVSSYLSQTPGNFPSHGQPINIQVTFKNDGTTTWSNSRSYHLVNIDGSLGTSSVLLPGGDVAPGAQVTFTIPFTGGGECTYWTTRHSQWHMVQDGVVGAAPGQSFSASGTSPNLAAPDIDVAWIGEYVVPGGDFVYYPESPQALTSYYQARMWNCGSKYWGGGYSGFAYVNGAGVSWQPAGGISPGQSFWMAGNASVPIAPGRHASYIGVINPGGGWISALGNSVGEAFHWQYSSTWDLTHVNVGGQWPWFIRFYNVNASTIPFHQKMTFDATQGRWEGLWSQVYRASTTHFNDTWKSDERLQWKSPVAGTIHVTGLCENDVAGKNGVRCAVAKYWNSGSFSYGSEYFTGWIDAHNEQKTFDIWTNVNINDTIDLESFGIQYNRDGGSHYDNTGLFMLVVDTAIPSTAGTVLPVGAVANLSGDPY